VSRAQARDTVGGTTKPLPDLSFDGDDLELDDFLISNERCAKANKPTRTKAQDFDDIDWFSIDSTPPSPVKHVPETAISREDDWAADMAEQDDEEYEPVRLANGKWACNHKCKNKTRFERISVVFSVKLMIPVANISAVGKAWTSHRSPQSGQCRRLRRTMVSIS
jgi:hypothetical protein